MRARVAHDVEHHEGDAGEMHDEQPELLNLWAHRDEATRARAGESGAGLAWSPVKRAATLVLVMLAMTASATVDARALASEGQKTQWAPTRDFSTLNARAVFASESRRATSPYAGEAAQTAAAAKEAGFTGHRVESALGLSYAKRRWLDSSTGTWLSRDDIGAASYLQSPNELNLWQYAAGNPTRFTDPSGRNACFEGEDHTKCEERLRHTGRLEGSPLQPRLEESISPLELEHRAAVRRNDDDARFGALSVGVGLSLAGGAGLGLLGAEGTISTEAVFAGFVGNEAVAGAAMEYGATGQITPEGVLISSVMGPLGAGPSVQLARSQIGAYAAYRSAVSPLVAPTIHSARDLMLTESRALSVADIAEAALYRDGAGPAFGAAPLGGASLLDGPVIDLQLIDGVWQLPKQQKRLRSGAFPALAQGKIPKLLPADFNRVFRSTKEIGDYGEELVRRILKSRGYTDLMRIQNSSGHGIDMVGLSPLGEWEFFEVKTSTTSTAPQLSEAQAKGADWFVRSRLERAAGTWKAIDPSAKVQAIRLREMMRRGALRPTGQVVRVTNAGSGLEQVTFTPWAP